MIESKWESFTLSQFECISDTLDKLRKYGFNLWKIFSPNFTTYGRSHYFKLG